MKAWDELTCAGCPAFATHPDTDLVDLGICAANFPRAVTFQESLVINGEEHKGELEYPIDAPTVGVSDWCLPGRRMMAAGLTFDPAPTVSAMYNPEWSEWELAKRGETP